MSGGECLGIESLMDRTIAQPGGALRVMIVPGDPARTDGPAAAANGAGEGDRQVAVAVVVDASLSMAHPAVRGGSSKWELAHQVLGCIHELLPADCSMVLVRFSQYARIVYTGRRPAALPFIDSPSDGAEDRWTNIGDALTTAGQALVEQAPDADIYRILLITDGVANFGRYDTAELVETADQLGAQGIGVDALGIGEDARDEVLAEIVGALGETQHVWATADDVKGISQTATAMVGPVFRAVAGRGEMRVLVRAGWEVEAVRLLRPQSRRLTVPAATERGTELRLPLPLVGVGDDRPAYLLRLRAPRRDHGPHVVLQVRGGVMLGGRRVAVDGRDVSARFQVRVDGSGFPDANPYLERREQEADLVDEVLAQLPRVRTEARVVEIYRAAAARATELGFTDLADAYTATLGAIDEGVSPNDAVSGAQVRATRTQPRTSDLVQPETRAKSRGQDRIAARRRLDEVFGGG